jgi:hypothetical protein
MLYRKGYSQRTYMLHVHLAAVVQLDVRHVHDASEGSGASCQCTNGNSCAVVLCVRIDVSSHNLHVPC